MDMTMPGWEMLMTFSFCLRFRAKGSRKAHERCAKDVSTRAMSCPRSNISQWHFGCFHSFVQTTTDLLIVIIVCTRVCLIWNIWFLMRILDFGKCNPYGTAKGGERFAKDLRKGGSWELFFSTTPIYKSVFFISIYLRMVWVGWTQHLSQTFASLTFPPETCANIVLEVPHTVPLVGDWRIPRQVKAFGIKSVYPWRQREPLPLDLIGEKKSTFNCGFFGWDWWGWC